LPPITREWLVALAPIALLVVLALWGAFVVLRPNPPRKVVLLTGTEQGAYAEFGRRYAQQLRRYGIEVELRETRGAAENLQGLRVNTGSRGSGAPNLFSKLLFANRIERSAIKESRLDPTPAVSAFLAGELDAIVFVSAPESPLVQMLLLTPGVKLADFAQSDAYA